MKLSTKKGMELSLETIVVFIIVLVVLVVMIYFFTTHYGSNSDTLYDIGNSAIGSTGN